MKKFNLLLIFGFIIFISNFSFGQVSLTSTSTSYTQNFNSLAITGTTNTWTDNTTIAGWYTNRVVYIGDDGTSTTGGLHSYGTTSATERSLGALTSGTVATLYMGVRLVNNTGLQVSSFDVSYVGEQWRQTANAHSLVFEYQVGATSISTGTWTAVSSLDFTALKTGTAGALNGNTSGNFSNKSATITVSVNNGQEIWFRWTKAGSTSPGLSIDDFSVKPNSAITPTVNISSPAISSGNVDQGAINCILMRYDLAVTNSNAILNGLTVTTGGSYINSDVTNLKVRYSNDVVLDNGDATLSTYVNSGSAGTIAFPSFTAQSISTGTTGYIFVTADISSSALEGNTINISTTPFLNISFSGTVNKTGTDPVAAGGSQTFQSVMPLVTLNSSDPSVLTGNIFQNSVNNVIYSFNLYTEKANATLSGLKINTLGNYISGDITNLKAWYSSDNTFNAATDVLLSTLTPVSAAGVQTFTNWTNQILTNGNTGYIFVTADISCSAVLNNTISVDALTITDLTIVNSDIIGLAFASESQTIQYASPGNANNLVISSPGNGQESITWTNPSGCFDEVMIVVSTATISETPTGNGSLYTGNLTYGNGTSFGGGYVVYKGSASPQIVSGLTNGNTYYFKIFTRNGTLWSSGIETSSFLAAPISPGNIYISHLSADYSGSSDEFVVLFNNTANPIDLNGYELKYFSALGSTGGAGFTFSTSTLIQPYQHLLLSPNAYISVGSVISKARDLGFTSGLAVSGQLVLRQTSNTSNIVFAVAWGTITTFVAGMTEAATWSGDGMISLTPSGTTYIYSGSFDYNFSNTAYSHTLSANIINVPSSSDGTLPVHISSLNSYAIGRDVTIKWSTESEINNSGFDIERKTVEGNWTKIGFVKGNGTTNNNSNYSFTDFKLNTGKYDYRLKQIDNNGNYTFYKLDNFVEVGIPGKFNLSQNYPNPFNPVTKIDFDLPFDSKVRLVVFDLLGREIKTIISGELKTAGYHTVELNALNLSSGTYFYRMMANSQSKDYIFTKKMVIVK